MSVQDHPREPEAPAAPTLSTVLQRVTLGAVRVAVGVTVGVPLVMYLAQERLLFHPQPLPSDTRRLLAGELGGVQEIEASTADGVALHGWLRHAERPGPRPLVLYFGGNAEEVSWVITNPMVGPDWSVAAVNYRGYGASGGKPSEKALFADALAIHDVLAAGLDIDAKRIVAMGRSLGSGVAVYLSAERPLAGTVLITPYDSVRSVAERAYPFLPVRFLLKHPFDSLERAPAIDRPALFLVAGEDRVIPPDHARRLYQAWGGAKTWVMLTEADHGSVVDWTGFRDGIHQFLRNVACPG